MDETNPREELYNQFKSSLKEPVSERYFSEDELVEIFDYAGDVADDYAQFEVLFCAARLYPDSPQLTDRKALFYLDTTESDDDPNSTTAKAFIADNPDLTSPLMDITRMEVNHPDNPVEALDFFLAQYDTLGDEEVIRLLDLACNLNEYGWLKDNFEKIRKKVPYAPTLLYEMMNRATEAEDYQTVVNVTEELIETEPFSAGYWATLFRAYAKQGKEEEARNAFSYAKDLATAEEDTTVFLADVIVECAPYLVEEGLEMLDNWLKGDPSNYHIFTARGSLMIAAQKFDKLESDLVKFTREHGVTGASLRHLFLLGHRGAGKIFAEEIRNGNGVFSAPEIEELLDNMHLNGNHVGMDEIMTTLEEAMGPQMSMPLAQYWMEALLNRHQYAKVIEIFKRYSDDELYNFLTFPPRGPSFWYVALLAMIRQEILPFAFVDIIKLHSALVEQIDVAPMPVKLTYLSLIQLVDAIINHPLSDQDFWQNYLNWL